MKLFIKKRNCIIFQKGLFNKTMFFINIMNHLLISWTYKKQRRKPEPFLFVTPNSGVTQSVTQSLSRASKLHMSLSQSLSRASKLRMSLSQSLSQASKLQMLLSQSLSQVSKLWMLLSQSLSRASKLWMRRSRPL